MKGSLRPADRLVVVALVYYGFSFLFTLSSRISSLRGTNSDEQVTDKGPAFTRAKIRYEFEGGKFYAATKEIKVTLGGCGG